MPSPTFDAMRIGGLRWAWQYAPDEATRAAAQTALRVYYADLLQRYDSANAMVLGPIGRSYESDYLGTTGVPCYLLACDLPSALAAARAVGPLAMYFALADYAPSPGLVALAEDRSGSREVRSRTPDPTRRSVESAGTCTWIGPGMSLGTMSGTVEPSSIPVLVTCDLPERPTSYFYAFGAPATVQSAQSGALALCSFTFDGGGRRIQVSVHGVLGRRDQIDRVIVERHGGSASLRRWVERRGGPATRFVSGHDLEVAQGQRYGLSQARVIEWYAEGNMDS